MRLPISTAPRDGTWFIAYENDDPYPCMYIEDEYIGEGPPRTGWVDLFNDTIENPTQWMPVPGATAARTTETEKE